LILVGYVLLALWVIAVGLWIAGDVTRGSGSAAGQASENARSTL
jgi:hypothetical protein